MDTAKEIDEKTGQQTTKRAHNLEKGKKKRLDGGALKWRMAKKKLLVSNQIRQTRRNDSQNWGRLKGHTGRTAQSKRGSGAE